MGFGVCGRATNGLDVMRLMASERPDLVQIDIYIQGMQDRIETAKRIKKEYGIPVGFVTSHADAPPWSGPGQYIPTDSFSNHLRMGTS